MPKNLRAPRALALWIAMTQPRCWHITWECTSSSRAAAVSAATRRRCCARSWLTLARSSTASWIPRWSSMSLARSFTTCARCTCNALRDESCSAAMCRSSGTWLRASSRLRTGWLRRCWPVCARHAQTRTVAPVPCPKGPQHARKQSSLRAVGGPKYQACLCRPTMPATVVWAVIPSWSRLRRPAWVQACLHRLLGVATRCQW